MTTTTNELVIGGAHDLDTKPAPKRKSRAKPKPAPVEAPKVEAKPAPKGDKLATYIAITAAATTVVFSMILNVGAFTATTGGVFGVALGIALPLWVLAATYIGNHMHDRSKGIAVFAYTLAGFMLLVSMPHLASGYTALGLTWWEGWALAIVTDLTQVVMKMAIIKMWHKS
jgi:hypothetical protein